MMWREVFTRKFTIYLAIEVVGFAAAITMVFTGIPFWIPAILCGVTLGFGLWGALAAAEGKLQ